MSFHMALDEVLFREREEAWRDGKTLPPLLRFYFADGPSVTIGYSHRREERGRLADPRLNHSGMTDGDDSRLFAEKKTVMHTSGEVCHSREGGNQREKDMPVVQRITGGGRVVHGKDVIFSLIAHKQHDESFHSVRVSYWKIHEALKAGFEDLGLKPRFYRCDEDLPEGPECFRYPISSDLALGKDKIAGGSQKRSAGALLHQESVVVPAGQDAFKMGEAFQRGFERIFKTTLEPEFLQPEWFEKAVSLAKDKYQPLEVIS